MSSLRNETPAQLATKLLVQAIFLLVTLASLVFLVQHNETASANTALSYNAGNIMSDQVMRNKASMTPAEIQAFLNAKGANCTSGSNCLKNYKEGGKTAARILYDTGQEFNINPQVLVVLLQKEVGLVTINNPDSWRYRTATGYGCPDSTPGVCNDRYYGFTNQLRWSATMFDAILRESPTWYAPYVVGKNTILYNPESSCGTTQVTIKNLATAALYSYTPYVPNQAALNAGYGEGNSCSSYGNRNFYQYFSDWFGSTQGYNVTATVFEGVTDKSGSFARVGFSLSPKPTSPVALTYEVSSSSNAQMYETRRVVISPENWDKPEKNVLLVRGKNNDNLRGTYAYTISAVESPDSADIGYRNTPKSLLPVVNLLQQEVVNNRDVYRLYSETAKKHILTASMLDRQQLISQGWRDEGVRFSYCEAGDTPIVQALNSANQEYRLVKQDSSDYKNLGVNGFSESSLDFTASSIGGVPVYWRYDPVNERSLYTTSSTEGLSAGFEDRGVAFYTCASDSVAVFRMYRPSNSAHFYTTSRSERNTIISKGTYTYEGTGFYTCQTSSTPVYRLYRKSNNAHFYTTSSTEASSVANKKYVNEGQKFYLCDNVDRNVYRFYRPSTESHFYTVSDSEKDSLSRNSAFRYEGIKLHAQ